MENENRVTGGDIFTQAWEDEAGGITADGREEEPLPEGPESGESEPGEDGGMAGDSGASEKGNGPEEGQKPDRLPILPRTAPNTPEARDLEIRQFAIEYPGVMPNAIPESVWRRVRAGESLVTAYTRHEAARLRQENRRLEAELMGRRQAESNRQRSAGSQMGAGTGKSARDPFDDGWELAW